MQVLVIVPSSAAEKITSPLVVSALRPFLYTLYLYFSVSSLLSTVHGSLCIQFFLFVFTFFSLSHFLYFGYRCNSSFFSALAFNASTEEQRRREKKAKAQTIKFNALWLEFLLRGLFASFCFFFIRHRCRCVYKHFAFLPSLGWSNKTCSWMMSCTVRAEGAMAVNLVGVITNNVLGRVVNYTSFFPHRSRLLLCCSRVCCVWALRFCINALSSTSALFFCTQKRKSLITVQQCCATVVVVLFSLRFIREMFLMKRSSSSSST